MYLINLLLTIFLIAISIFIFVYQKFSVKLKTLFFYCVFMLLLVHHFFILNLKTFKQKQIKDISYEKDLDEIKNTNTDIYRTKELEMLQSCRDVNDKKKNFSHYFIRNQLVLIRGSPHLKLKEMVYNVLLRNFNKKQILNFNLDYQAYTPELSVFKLGQLERKFFFYKLVNDLKKHDVIVFFNPRSTQQLRTMIQRLDQYRKDKLFIFMVPTNILFPLFKEKMFVQRIRCQEYDKEEFQYYLDKKNLHLKDVSSKELIELVGRDTNIIDKIFKEKKRVYNKDDIMKSLDSFTMDLQLQTLDKCHVQFLKNMIIEYYKINHKTEKIMLENLMHQKYKCNSGMNIQKVVNNLKKQRIIQVQGKYVTFYSAVVKNALLKYFE